MAAPWRKLRKTAILASVAIITGVASIAARAEINLNRLVFPKAQSTSPSAATADDPPPQMPGVTSDENSQPPKRVQQRQPYAQDNRTADANNHRSATPRNVPASYQSSGPSYQSQPTGAANQSPSNSSAAKSANANWNPTPYGSMNRSGNSMPEEGNRPGGYSPNRYSGYGMNGSQRGGWSVASMFGMEGSQRPSGAGMASMVPNAAPQSVMQNGPTGNFPPGSVVSDHIVGSGTAPTQPSTSTGRPLVKSNAVYLEGETIPPGTMRGGMPGGSMNGGAIMSAGPMYTDGAPMMGHGDGFSNPYCNDCGGGYPGCSTCDGGCGGGCGHEGCFSGWFGGGSGCGECSECEGECGDCHKCPYGRPWILAPIDLIVYVLGPPGDGSGWWGENFSVFAGVHNFRGPVNLVGQSNFGTQEGVNWGIPLWEEIGLGAQVGVGITQSNFQDTGFTFDDYRKQTFVTGGLFHRPACGQGLQGGLVFDWLHDDFYDRFDIAQLRGEISWLMDCRNEIGFWFATGVMQDDVRHQFLSPATFEVLDQYAFFYRRHFCRGGDARIWGGFTGQDAGLVGFDFSLPVARCWSIEGGCNYVITDQHTQGQTDESWNIGMNLVWSWGCNSGCRCNAYRPLFGVADNGSLMTRIIDRSQLGAF